MIRVLDNRRGQRAGVEDEEDFLDEVHVLSQLDHANVVRLVGFVVSSRPWLIVTQLSTGASLYDYLRRLTDAAAADPLRLLCRQMSSAVAYLASRRY